MENTNNSAPRRPNPRRRKRSMLRKFKEIYLPAILVIAVIIFFVVFISGSIRRSNAKREQLRQESIAASQSEAQLRLEQEIEINQLIAKAEAQASSYDYDGAIATLDSFSGNLYDYDVMIEYRDKYVLAKEALVAWDDPSQVVNLSFHLLIADPQRAFHDKGYSDSYRYNFVTTTEFSGILDQLYANGYILVDIEDLFTATENTDGTYSYASKTLYLPEGKKPLMLTQTQVNYHTYMTDSDGDGLADKGGGGFASRLIVDATGALTCEYIDANGTTHTGEYDLVPILESFIARNPDFSYQGARAILAVSGYDGLFGYRTDPETAQKISQDYYEQQKQQLPTVLSALREKGYRIACYTYKNVAYGKISATEIRQDLDRWKEEVTPLLGETDILVLAKVSDIADPGEPYSGDKFNVLYNAGFRYFLGFEGEGASWCAIGTNHVRQGRLMVTGNSLTYRASTFADLFDADSVLDPKR